MAQTIALQHFEPLSTMVIPEEPQIVDHKMSEKTRRKKKKDSDDSKIGAFIAWWKSITISQQVYYLWGFGRWKVGSVMGGFILCPPYRG